LRGAHLIRVLSSLVRKKFSVGSSGLPEGYSRILLICIAVFLFFSAALTLGTLSAFLLILILQLFGITGFFPKTHALLSPFAKGIIFFWILFYLICFYLFMKKYSDKSSGQE
jgi:hypothetical protein